MGEVFAGRYELIDPIASGGMGTVWRVLDRTDGQVKAAKVLHHRPTPTTAASANAEESTEAIAKRSTADLPESTPAPITATFGVMGRPSPSLCSPSRLRRSVRP